MFWTLHCHVANCTHSFSFSFLLNSSVVPLSHHVPPSNRLLAFFAFHFHVSTGWVASVRRGCWVQLRSSVLQRPLSSKWITHTSTSDFLLSKLVKTQTCCFSRIADEWKGSSFCPRGRGVVNMTLSLAPLALRSLEELHGFLVSAAVATEHWRQRGFCSSLSELHMREICGWKRRKTVRLLDALVICSRECCALNFDDLFHLICSRC